MCTAALEIIVNWMKTVYYINRFQIDCPMHLMFHYLGMHSEILRFWVTRSATAYTPQLWNIACLLHYIPMEFDNSDWLKCQESPQPHWSFTTLQSSSSRQDYTKFSVHYLIQFCVLIDMYCTQCTAVHFCCLQGKILWCM